MKKLSKYLAKNKNSNLFFGFLALIGGAILPLAFAPFGYYLVAEFSLLLLIFTWFKSSSKLAFWRGWLFGLAFFGFGLYWVYISIHYYGQAPVGLSILIVVLLVAFMSLYLASQGYLLNRFYPKNDSVKFLVVFPAMWVILEWLRGWIFSGFPWLFLGYSHINSPLAGWATIFGVYGVSFFIAQTAGAIFLIFHKIHHKKHFVFLCSLIITVWSVGFSLTKINWGKQSGDLIQVSLIQGNVKQELKWDPNELIPTLNYYAFLTAKHRDSKIVVWPEAAISGYLGQVWFYLKLISFVADTNGSTILSGVLFDKKDEDLYYNGIVALGADSGKYYKRKLVPFGEYLPFKWLLSWLRNFLIIPMSGFSSGSKSQSDLVAQGIIMAPFVCYEIAYPDLILDYLPKAGLMVTVNDDSWFGDSIAAYQHLEIAQMRSLEVARYQLFATNTGVTAIIDPHGKVVDRAPMFEKAVLTNKVAAFSGSTPWVSFGKYLWLPILFLGLYLGRSGKK